MATDLSFSLESTESSPWFQRLGRGKTRVTLPGTWAGSVTLDVSGPNGTAYPVRDVGGAIIAITSNTGVFETEETGAMRITFTRVSGTLTPYVWSNESQLDMPFGFTFEDGDIFVMEDGDYLQMENG